MPKRDSLSASDLSTLREILLREELRRIRFASIGVIGIAAMTFLFLLARSLGQFAEPTWQFVALLAFATFCVALPLISKLNITSEGGGLETTGPLQLIDKMQEAQAARVESFEQLRQQISGISSQLDELAEGLSRTAPGGAGATPTLTDSLEPDAEPSLRRVRKLLPAPTVGDDPQSGRFGGKSTSPTRRLSATVEPSDLGGRYQKVTLLLSAAGGAPDLDGAFAYFFLHDSFDPDAYRAKVAKDGRSARFEISSYGAFTVGVAADRGATLLELDLAGPEVKAPEGWKKR